MPAENASINSRPRRDTRRVAIALLLLLAGLLISIRFTGAVYTDTATVTNNSFTVGEVDISASPGTALFSVSAMAPGSAVTAPLTVSNDGTLDLRYAIESETDEDVLAAELELTLKSGVTTCTNGAYAATGTVLYGPGPIGSTGTIALVGDAAQGADSGDRTLTAGNNEVLCFHVELPLDADTASQGITSTTTFTFLAEQTANNP